MSTHVDISEGLLFPVVESLSPRLAWMRKHGVVTYLSLPNDPEARCWYATLWSFAGDFTELAGCKSTDSQDVGLLLLMETGRNGEQRIGEGSTEDEAIADFCNKAGLRLWNEEGEV